jgi:hypothetical protein
MDVGDRVLDLDPHLSVLGEAAQLAHGLLDQGAQR